MLIKNIRYEWFITTILNTKSSEVENKIPDTTSLVTTTVLNIKTSKVENKIHDNSKYITTQADLVDKTDFGNKLTSFNMWITSNKTKHLKVQNKLNTLITKDTD